MTEVTNMSNVGKVIGDSVTFSKEAEAWPRELWVVIGEGGEAETSEG
ncbi:uncharacterized protein G2W53_021753 [Senna tora]|uniref:Uncharacterized protein n=1 Tax=Senna tora TaxID=362788 RepID=A0A834WNN9_9FABA|nr:uncharacterized protein G2W53_021753 [Senna tora]